MKLDEVWLRPVTAQSKKDSARQFLTGALGQEAPHAYPEILWFFLLLPSSSKKMVNLAAQAEQFLRRGGQVPRQAEPKGGWMQKHIMVLESALQQVLQLPGLRNIWGLLGSAEKIDQPPGGTGTVSDAVARHSLGRA